MRYRVVHRTTYVYDDEVSASYGLTHLLPRDTASQRVIDAEVTIEPEPEDRHVHDDTHGNRTEYFAIHRGHTRLDVTSSSTVEVTTGHPDVSALGDTSWEEVAAAAKAALEGTGDAPVDPDLVAFLLPSPSVPTSPALSEFAAPSFAPGRPVVDAVLDLASRIHGEFTFLPGATTVTTTVAQVLRRRKGVCQDFAHLMVGSLRSVGIPARYVSGYLETDPPPGRARLEGADVSHAWVGVWLPGVGWIDVDPTNDQLVAERYVTTAWGRDYGDVTPLKGVIFTDGKTDELTVTVDVARQQD